MDPSVRLFVCTNATSMMEDVNRLAVKERKERNERGPLTSRHSLAGASKADFHLDIASHNVPANQEISKIRKTLIGRGIFIRRANSPRALLASYAVQ
jgi:hypothetical protein